MDFSKNCMRISVQHPDLDIGSFFLLPKLSETFKSKITGPWHTNDLTKRKEKVNIPILSIWVDPVKRLEPMLESEVLSVVVPRLEVTEVMVRPSSAKRLARRAFRSAGLRLVSVSETIKQIKYWLATHFFLLQKA